MKIINFEEISSTNVVAKEMIKKGDVPPFSLLAKRQTNGIGRFLRHFYSPSGGLYLTIVLNEQNIKAKFTTGFVAVSLVKVIKKYYKKPLEIKWVNDIYTQGQKIAGILVEKVNGVFIIGIGVNLKQNEPVPEDLKHKMGFLNIDVDVQTFAEQLINEIAMSKLTSEEVIEKYLKHCSIVGAKQDFDRGIFGEVLSINEDGSLNVKTDKDEQIRIFA